MKQDCRQNYQARGFFPKEVQVHQNIIYYRLPLAPHKFKEGMKDTDNRRLVSKVTSYLIRLNIEKFKQNH